MLPASHVLRRPSLARRLPDRIARHARGAALLLPLVVTSALADWPPGGILLWNYGYGTRVHGVPAGFHRIAPASDSSCLVVRYQVLDTTTCTGRTGLLAVFASGTVRTFPDAGAPARDAAPDGAGGAFELVGCTALRVVRWTASGELAPGWPAGGVEVGASGMLSDAALVPDGAGGAFAAWNDVQFGSVLVRIQHVTAAGATASPGGLPVAVAPGSRRLSALLADGAGGAFVVIEDDRALATGGSDVFAQHVNGALDRLWGDAAAAACAAPGDQRLPGATRDGAGGLYLAWQDHREGGGDLYATRLGPAGTPMPGWPDGGLLLHQGSNTVEIRLAPDAAGGAILSSVERGYYTYQTRARVDHLLPAGSLDPTWPVIEFGDPCCLLGVTDLAPDGAGGAFFAWEYQGSVRALRLGPDGHAAPGWDPAGVRVNALVEHRVPAANDLGLALARPGEAFLAWDLQSNWDLQTCGYHEVCYDRYLYAQYLVPEGVVPVLAALVSVDADQQRVRLVWQVSTSAAITVERSPDGAPWLALGAASPDGSGRVAFEDSNVEPGHRYGYRLALGGPDARSYAGEAWVEVPARAGFALAGARPNPSGRLAIAFSLPDGAPARLEVMDVAGRRVFAREVGALGPGSHVVGPDEGLPPAPGVYQVRLTRAGHALTSRAVLMR